MRIDNIAGSTLQLQLPSWRPGRYELGNFAKNIKKFEASDDANNSLTWKKLSKDLWEISGIKSGSVIINYSYYAAELNAGSTFVDEKQIYSNPVNCCMYVPERTEEEHQIELVIPENYSIACSLPVKNKRTLLAKNFEELADSPFIASANLQSFSVLVKNIPFYLHFNGECLPDKKILVEHFEKFITENLNFFGSAPFDHYHFLFQILSTRFYHGVEHLKNTVIALGPGHSLMEGSVYADLLGVSCHELFHSWNIKSIRPVEMYPYDYTKENYARTGYVYEGFTTYYGDKLLLTSGVFSDEEYFQTLEERLDKHFHNFGRFNLSLADSSYDNWLDGYVPGAPYRKVSIYDEGNLIAFMLDVKIMQGSGNKYSLRNVLLDLYHNFFQNNKGYSEQDIITLCNKYAGYDLSNFFSDYVYGTSEYEQELEHCFDYLGLKMLKKNQERFYESRCGFKITEGILPPKVSMIAPYSPAWDAGLQINDELLSLNGIKVNNDLNALLKYHFQKSGKLNLLVSTTNRIREIEMQIKSDENWYQNRKIVFADDADGSKRLNFNVWKSPAKAII